MIDNLVYLVLVGLFFAVICHGHSRKLMAPSGAAAFLACMAIIIIQEALCPDCGLVGIFFPIGFPIYFILSFIVGLLYKTIRHVASERNRLTADSGDSMEGEMRPAPAASRPVEIFWKIAFWSIFLLQAFGFFFESYAGKLSDVWDWIDALMTTGAIIGFYLYAYRQKVGSAFFWKLFAVFFIGWDFFVNIVVRGYQENFWIAFLIISPMYLALILYGFRFQRTVPMKI